MQQKKKENDIKDSKTKVLMEPLWIGYLDLQN